ncbi:hypothetical protein KUCAC02_004305 [Scomber scombrus]|uniref:Uncharacterized protein n=1 Tax=Scomber scombrus TaxID=13677 RepID=A0AAV1PSZ0_SCOSC
MDVKVHDRYPEGTTSSKQRTLNKMVGDHPERWDDFLPPTMFALRTNKQLTTQYSPYYLMFGREERYPSEVPKEYEIMYLKERRFLFVDPFGATEQQLQQCKTVTRLSAPPVGCGTTLYVCTIRQRMLTICVKPAIKTF